MLNRADLALHQVMTLDSRADTLKSLSETRTKMVAIEREAHGVGSVDLNKPPPTWHQACCATFRLSRPEGQE